MSRIKRLRGYQRQSHAAASMIQCEEPNSREEDVSSSCQEDLEFLKVAVVNEANMHILKSKLVATSAYRLHLISTNHSIDLLENFPYFFHNQSLVCHQKLLHTFSFSFDNTNNTY